MSAVSEIHTRWGNSASLIAQIPAASFYTAIVPEVKAFPFAVLVPVGTTFVHTSCDYIEQFRFQIFVWASTAATAETIAALVRVAFSNKQIASATINCEPVNDVPVVSLETGEGSYGVMLEYILHSDREYS